jgi:glycosyltransferase involved in cell wall biosynthesis
MGRHRAPTVRRGVILYVASSNPYNRHGLSVFLTHAWQTIVSAYPDAQLHVVGGVTQDDVGPHDRVVFRGYVTDADLAELYSTAHVVINPQVNGTGLKIKCVEALSSGCPLVMNEAGADGIEVGRGSAFLVARDWQDFARHVLRILHDDGYRLAIETTARQFASQWLAEPAVFEEFSRVLDEHHAAMGA